MEKAARQRLVASLIARSLIGTQQELLEALARAGVDVTQATVSRDIAELGLEKTVDPVGRPRYVLPQERRRRDDPERTLLTLFEQFGRSVTSAQNIVVVHSEIGSAPAIARALDRLGHPDVIATLAGDDTCLVIAPDAGRAEALAEELRRRME